VIDVTQFGASAPAKENFKHYGFTVDNIVERAEIALSLRVNFIL
jgi:transketolase